MGLLRIFMGTNGGFSSSLAAVYLLYSHYTPLFHPFYIPIIQNFISQLYTIIYPWYIHYISHYINPLHIHLSHVISFYIPFISHLYHSYLAAVWTWLSQVVAALLANSWEPGCGWWMRKSSIDGMYIHIISYNVYIYIYR